ncbi:hypothetical protein PIB30_020112 [Stylosanthes scabra]|uniref:Uncharacterized protein n=1 Tax=Stylosanthes scabra TaxID=79078 RepID=A0ABU6X797_9FABA|nr:hypothetical protein [Stylosanthes scabra]
METENNTSNANIQDINADNQLHHNEPIHPNILDDLVGSMKHIPTDKGKKVIEDNVQLKKDTYILLSGSDPEDISTLVNGRKSSAINIIDLDEEIIAQSGNVNFTRTYLRTKAKKAARAAGDKELLNKDYMLNNDSLLGRKGSRPKASKGPKLLSKEIGCVLPVELKSKFRPTIEMHRHFRIVKFISMYLDTT